MFEQPSLLFGERKPDADVWQIPSALPVLSNVTRLSLDTETDGVNVFKNNPVGISIAYPSDSGLSKMYIPFGHSSGNIDPDLVRRWANYELRNKEIVFAHAKFDIHVLKRWGVDLEALGVKPMDVQFGGALLDDSPHVRVDLDTLGMRYAGVGKLHFPYDKNKMAELPSHLVGAYAEKDAEVTLLVHQAMMPFIQREELQRVMELENSIIYAVCEIEKNGCRIDVEKLERWRLEVRAQYEQTLMHLYKTTGFRVAPDSAKSMLDLFQHLHIEPPVPLEKKSSKKKKKEDKDKVEKSTGLRKFSEEELKTLKHPVIDKVIEARQLASLLSKFLDKYHDGLDGDIIRSQFHQLKTTTEQDEKGEDKGQGTVSGRFSSSGGKDPSSGFSFNAQQVIKPKLQRDTLGDVHIIRELFIPEEDRDSWSADQKQIEYRLAAHFAGAEKIIQAYQDPDADFHAINQALIQKYKPEHNDRTITKNVGFAYTFGANDERLAATARISRQDASELLSILKREAPEFPVLLQSLSKEAERNGYVTTIFGRRSRFGTYETRYYAALNRVVQGSAADIFKVNLKAVYEERHNLGITKLRQVVHDEMNGDCERGEETRKKIEDFLNQQRVPVRVPILWDLKTGANWKECH